MRSCAICRTVNGDNIFRFDQLLPELRALAEGTSVKIGEGEYAHPRCMNSLRDKIKGERKARAITPPTMITRLSVGKINPE